MSEHDKENGYYDEDLAEVDLGGGNVVVFQQTFEAFVLVDACIVVYKNGHTVARIAAGPERIAIFSLSQLVPFQVTISKDENPTEPMGGLDKMFVAQWDGQPVKRTGRKTS